MRERTVEDMQPALEAAGVEFTNGDQPGVKMRRMQVGDLVRLRHPLRLKFRVDANETGKLIAAGGQPPETGPTYRITVKFLRGVVSGEIESHFELVKAVGST